MLVQACRHKARNRAGQSPSQCSPFNYKITAALHEPLKHRKPKSTASTPMPLCCPPAPHVHLRVQYPNRREENKQKPVLASPSVLSFNLHSSWKVQTVSALTRLSPKRTGKCKYGRTTDSSEVFLHYPFFPGTYTRITRPLQWGSPPPREKGKTLALQGEQNPCDHTHTQRAKLNLHSTSLFLKHILRRQKEHLTFVAATFSIPSSVTK